MRMAIADLRPQLKNAKYYDDTFRPFHIDTKELLKQLHGDSNNRIYGQLRKACRNLAKVIEIGDITHFDIYAVFDRISFDIKKGLDMQFSRSMEKFLLQLEHGEYTRTMLQLAFSLSSTYALILLELMLQYQGMQKNGIIERELSMEELRFSMDVPEDAYGGRIDNFKRCVLDAAIREINEKTDYRIEPKYGLLRGRYNKVTGFHFVLHLPETKEPEKELPALSDGMEERLRKYGVHWSTARRLAKMPHAEECLQIALEHIREGKARNPASYIKAAIEQDWQGQREAVRMALEAEHRERMGKQERRMDSAAGDAGCPERPLRSLAEIAEGDSPFSEMARKILDRRKKAARSKQASASAGGEATEKAAPKRGTAGKERKGISGRKKAVKE